jgi:hypothetical protein
MIPAPDSVRFCADLTLYAGLGVTAAFGIGLIALAIRRAIDIRRERREETTIKA